MTKPPSLVVALVFAIVLFLDVGDAFAYVDPGTGSMLLQALFGGLAGLAVVARLSWRKVRRLIGTSRDSAGDDTSGT